MAEVVESGGRGKGKKKARIGLRMDMTPMVDVAFLLLTFFMLSTTLTTPQVMEITLPPDSKVDVQIAESNLLTLRVLPDKTVFWNMGNETPVRISQDKLNELLTQHLKANPKLATLIKIDRSAHYQALVDFIDELNIVQGGLGQTERRFSLLPMDDADHKAIANL